MEILPFAFRPISDELLISHIYRLYTANELSFECFKGLFDGVVSGFDIRFDLAEFHRLLSLKGVNMADIFGGTTIFGYDAVFMRREQQIRFLETYSSRKNNLFYAFSAVGGSHGTVNLCPECIRESRKEYGCNILYRAHQLNRVKVCHKHHVPLYIFNTGKTDFADFAEAEDIIEQCQKILINDTDIDTEVSFAEFSKKILDAGFNIDIDDLKQIISVKLKDLGYGLNVVGNSSLADSFVEDFSSSKYSVLLVDNVEKFSRLLSLREVKSSDMVVLLMFLYNCNFEQFSSDVRNYIGRKGYSKDLLAVHKCPDCGSEYLQTSSYKKLGGLCPVCYDSAANTKSIFDVVSGGEYEYFGDFCDFSEKNIIRHVSCGKTLKSSLSRFLFNGSRCECQGKLSFDNVRKQIESSGEFQLLQYKNTNSDIEVLHRQCGRTIKTNYINFLRHMGCSYCRDNDRKDFAKAVRELTGDEYEVLGDYINIATPVSMKHKVCGRTFDVIPGKFKAGRRCQYCKSKNLVDNKVGQVATNKAGQKMRVIAYRNYKDIDVQFEDGTVLEHVRYERFQDGILKNPNAKVVMLHHTQSRSAEQAAARVGMTNIANNGLKMTIIEYHSSADVDIKFEDGVVVEHKRFECFLIGSIKHPTVKAKAGCTPDCKGVK